MEGGDIDAAARAAEIVVTREYRMNRQSGAPMEGRAVLAYRDHRLDEIVVYASTQTPHTVRVAIGEILGLDERRIRVVAPDVGGGFGRRRGSIRKRSSSPRSALELDHPVRWIEDRNEHLLTAAHTRDHHYKVTAYADRRGQHPRHRRRDHRRCRRLWVVAARALPGSQHGGARPARPLQDRRTTAPATITVATNKAPLGPYRGVGRPGACFAIERTIDEVARAVGRDPVEVRIENMIPRRSRCRTPRSPACATTPAIIRPACGSAPSCWTAGRSARGSSAASRTAG